MERELKPTGMVGPTTATGRERPEDDEIAIQALRTGLSVGSLFLLAYLAYDSHRMGGGLSAMVMYHWATVVAALLLYGLSWTRGFRRHWRIFSLIFADALIVLFILISSHTRDPDPRFIAVLLFPFATASLVNWDWRWQGMMGASCAALYAVGEKLVPLPGSGSFYRWLGVLAAVTLAHSLAVFIGRYRRGLHAQLADLVKAAALRQGQIATMAHDIRSPMAAIAGFVELLEDQELSVEERRAILARIRATAWSLDLAVGNVLDLYQFQEGHISCAPIVLDPNRIVAEAASNCEPQAARRGLRLRTDYGVLPHASFDPRHLERIARNLIAYSISRLKTGEIALRTYPRDGAMMMEVEDTGPAPAAEELSRMLAGPDVTGVSLRSATLGLYVARTLAERTGGRIEAKISEHGGLKFVVELRQVPPEPKRDPA